MRSILNIKKKLLKFEILLIIALIIFFALTKISTLDYGLPFFEQEDENAFLKSTISFISFVTNIKPVLVDPTIAPLLNLLLSLKLIFINEYLINSLSISEIKNLIYYDPSILIYYGRIISLAITSLSFYFLYLIFKKLKINFFVSFILLISLSLSLFSLTLSLVNGKNSYYFLFFVIQLYFFLKYYLKLEKFNKKSYLILSFLASLAWGTNYWSAIVSFYGVVILHYKKFGFKFLGNLLIFLISFTILGFLPTLTTNSFFLNFFF